MEKVAKEKYTGCLMGGAIGDALGAPIEFKSLTEIREAYGQTGVSGYVEYEDGTGEYTDDTQMTLFTAEALLRAYHRAMLKGVEGALTTIAHQSYLRWLHTQNGCVTAADRVEQADDAEEKGWLIRQPSLYRRRAPGNTCISALSSGRAGTIERRINNSKGCGTIMRIAPVGLMYDGDHDKAFEVACKLSAITHGHPTGYLSAGFLAAVIADLAVGIELETAIGSALSILKERPGHRETMDAVESAKDLAEEIRRKEEPLSAETMERLGGGWVAEEALSLSIFASLTFKDYFAEGVLFSVNHGGDSDSTGSITGNILGLIHGIDRIPQEWVKNLRNNGIVRDVAADLYMQVKGSAEEPDSTWWERYPGC
jgi:ADP-ribosylglycohydrolase